MEQRRKLTLLYLVLLSGLALDLWTKFWAAGALLRRGPIVVIKGFFELRYAENTAVAFSMLRFIPAGLRWWIIIVLNILVFLTMQGLVYCWRRKRLWKLLPFAVISGGALGNICDRLFRRHVVDFLYFHYRQWSYPIFNVADSLIFIGVVLMLIANWDLLSEQGPGKEAETETEIH